MSLVSLSYVSVATHEMSQEDLTDILTTARSFNSANDITGMLLYRNGYFIQALEGEEAQVMALYEKISRDPRHRHVLRIHKQAISARSFGDWSMGFHTVDDNILDENGFNHFLDEPFDTEILKNDASRALKLLELFKEGGSF